MANTSSTTTSASGSPGGTEYPRRADFLIAMYEQLMGDINRHIVVVWQMVGVLGAAVAGLVLAEKQGIPTAYAAILVIVVTGWVIEHLHDSNFWYNRNLVMITNIERVFLTKDDVDYIHPYFSAHRKKGSFLTHLAIQRTYALAVAWLIMAYFVVHSVVPTWRTAGEADISKWLPFLMFAGLLVRDDILKKKYERKYQEYIAISPGIAVPRKVNFGSTHGAQ